MHPVIHFQSRLFDTRAEPENPINPIPGKSLLDWLGRHLPGMTAPAPEDWGWYSYVQLDGRQYMLGSCAHVSEDGNHEWVLQIDKTRSFKEKLLGQAKMSLDDPCFALVHGLVQHEAGFTAVSVEGDS